MKISELIAAVGDDNVALQFIDQCADDLKWSAGKGTKITFGTDVPLLPTGTVKLGIVVWLDRDAVKAALAAARGAGVLRARAITEQER